MCFFLNCLGSCIGAKTKIYLHIYIYIIVVCCWGSSGKWIFPQSHFSISMLCLLDFWWWIEFFLAYMPPILFLCLVWWGTMLFTIRVILKVSSNVYSSFLPLSLLLLPLKFTLWIHISNSSLSVSLLFSCQIWKKHRTYSL